MGLSSPFRRILRVFSTLSPALPTFPGAQDHLFLRMRSLVREEEASQGAQGLEDGDGDPLCMDFSWVYYWLLYRIDYNNK